EQTFQSLALTVLLLVLYFCLVRALALVPRAVELPTSAVPPAIWQDVQLVLDPYQCLQCVLDDTAPKTLPVRPPLAFGLAMLFWSMLISALGIARLRVWNPSRWERGTRGPKQDANELAEPAKKPDVARNPEPAGRSSRSRAVWSNP